MMVSLLLLFSSSVGRFSHGFVRNTIIIATSRRKVTQKIVHHQLTRLFSSTIGKVAIDDMTGWSIQSAIETSCMLLQHHNVIEPQESVQHLLASSLQDLTWESGYRDVLIQPQHRQLTKVEATDFTTKLQRRLSHEPIQYILGKWDFLDYTAIKICPPLLCPRPETEELVQYVLQETTESPIHILDVGCGTGVIGIALADQLPDAFVQAIDIEPIAIETSIQNAKQILGESQYAACYQAELCAVQDYDPKHFYDIVVSNPPYIPQKDMESLTNDVLQYESSTALCGGEDGLDIIRIIIEKLPEWCNNGATCYMEVDPSHPILIQKITEGTPNVVYEKTIPDMFGKDRFVKLRIES